MGFEISFCAIKTWAPKHNGSSAEVLTLFSELLFHDYGSDTD